MEVASFANLEEVGDDFLSFNRIIIEVDLPKLKNAGNYFLNFKLELTRISLPSLEVAGESFMSNCFRLSEVDLPKLTSIGYSAFKCCNKIRKLCLPELTKADSFFLTGNFVIEEISLPKLELMPISFMGDATVDLKKINLPILKEVKSLQHSKIIKGWVCEQVEARTLAFLDYTGNEVFPYWFRD